MADIVLTDLTDGSLDVNNEWAGNGIFDKLIGAVNKNIEGQYNLGRINGSDYASVYLGSMQSVIAQSMQYVLQEKLQEAQIDGVLADTELKTKQLDVVEREMLEKEATGTKQRILLDEEKESADLNQILLQTEETIKEAQLLDTQKATDVKERTTVLQEAESSDKLVTTAKQRVLMDEEKETADLQQVLLGKDSLLKDEQIETENKNQLLLDTEEEVKTAQLAEIVDGTVRANTQLDDQIATSVKQRTLLDTEEEAKQYEVDNLLPEQLTKVQEEIDLLQSQDSELLLNGTKDRDVKERQTVITETDSADKLVTSVKQRLVLDEEVETANKQQILLDTQEEAEQYRVDSILPVELSSLSKDIDVKERQMVETESTGVKQRLLLDEEKETADLQQELAEIDRLSKVYEKDNILPANLADILTTTDVKERQIIEAEATGIKQRLDIDKGIEVKGQQITGMVDELLTTEKQRTILDTEEEIKQYEHDVLQLDQHNTSLKQIEEVTKQIEVSERNIVLQEAESADKLVTTVKQRELVDEEIETANKQQEILGVELKVVEQKIVGRKQSAVTSE